jgi:uncharacterized membrane protein
MERALSVVSGGFLVGYAALKRSKFSLPLAVVGAVALYRGVTGHCPAYRILDINRAQDSKDQIVQGITLRESVQVDQPVEQVYRYWRDMENLPRFIHHLESVQPLNETRSRWTAKAGDQVNPITWEAEILFERQNQLIVWRSLPGAPVESQVVVEFKPIQENKSTELVLQLIYAPPPGEPSTGAAPYQQLFQSSPEAEIQQDLERFKEILRDV